MSALLDFLLTQVINNGAPLFAAALLAADDPALARKLAAFRQKQTTLARAKQVPPA